MSNKFFKFDETDLEALVNARLTTKEILLWHFLCLLEPFGDRSVEIPPFEVIEQKLNISKTTYYCAKTKLQEKGLWNFTDKHTVALNLRGHARTNVPNSAQTESFRKSELDFGESNPISENRTEFRKSELDFGESENRDSEPREDKGSSVSQTLHTDHTFSYSPDCVGEKEKKDKQETGQENYGTRENVSTNNQNVENNCSISQDLNQDSSKEYKVTNEDKNFRSGSISEANSKGMVQGSSTEVETNNPGNAGAIAPVVKPQLRSNQLNPVQQINWQWLPDGAWKTPEGKLDPHFQEWFAKIFFVEQFGHEFNLAVANVESYFRNDLRRLSTRWKQYHKEYVAKLKNTSMLLDHGVKIPEERRKNTINRVRAIQPVASEQSVSTNPTPVNSNLESLESIVNSVTTPQVNPQNILNPAVNSGVEELEAEVIEAETINDPWIEESSESESALTKIEVKDTQIEVTNTQIEVKDTQPKYVYIDNSDCPDPEVISVVYRDFTGIAEQMEKERREAPPINPLAKAMIEDFTTIISGKPVDRPVGERIEIINYALSHSGRNKYFFAQAQQFINQGWKVDFNDEGEPLYIHADSKPLSDFSPNSNPNLNDSGKNPIDSKLLIEKAKELNEALKDKFLRSSSHYIHQVKQFLSLDWLADYDSDGYPIEVYQF